jgi:transposase-like protein
MEALALNHQDPRMVRGCEILSRGVFPEVKSEKVFKVPSQSSDKIYSVVLNPWGWTCSCPDHIYRKTVCKHIHAVLFYRRLREAISTDETMALSPPAVESVSCKRCDSLQVVRNGTRKTKYGMKPRYLCRDCGKSFSFDDEYNGFNGLRHDDPKVVTACLDMYFKGASVRGVTDHITQIYGVKISPSTVYRYIRRFTEIIKGYVDTLEPEIGERWHADEQFIKAGDRLYYVWSVMDGESRYILSNLVSKKRSTVEAREVFKKAKDHAKGKPSEVVTDGLPSYKKAFNKVFYDHHRSVKHAKGVGITGAINNNRIERYHGAVRDREKVFRGVNGDEKALQGLMDGYRIYHNFVKRHKTLGMTPAEKAGIRLELGRNKWLGLIQKAIEEEKSVKT